MERESFVIYSSWVEVIRKLPEDIQLHMCNVLFDYGLKGIEPINLSPLEDMLFGLIKPQMDSNNKRYVAGCKGGKFGVLGGAPKGNKNACKNWEKTSKQPLGVEKTTPNDNDNVYDNENENEFSSKDENNVTETSPVMEKMFGNQYLNDFQCNVQAIYDECGRAIEFDRKHLGQWIDPKTGAVRNTKEEFVNKYHYKDVYDMIRDFLVRIKSLPYRVGWDSDLCSLWKNRTKILNVSKPIGIGTKEHFDWYLNNVVNKLKFTDYDGEEKFYLPPMYSTYLWRECGIDKSEAQELRDKFLSD